MYESPSVWLCNYIFLTKTIPYSRTEHDSQNMGIITYQNRNMKCVHFSHTCSFFRIYTGSGNNTEFWEV